MEETKIEETVENQITEEEKKEIETLEGKNEEELTDVEKKNKKLYARMKEAVEGRKSEKEAKAKIEEELTNVRKELDALKSNGEKNNNTEKKDIDPIILAKQVRTLSSLTDDEIAYAQILAKGMDKTVEDAIGTSEFKTWSNAKKEEEKKAKGLDPNNRIEGDIKEDPFFKKFSSNLPKGFEIKNNK